MKRLLRIASPILAVAITGTWAALGMNTGWTINKIPTRQTDTVTGIDHTVWTEKWVPGVDFLAAGLACSAALLIASIPRKPKKSSSSIS